MFGLVQRYDKEIESRRSRGFTEITREILKQHIDVPKVFTQVRTKNSIENIKIVIKIR